METDSVLRETERLNLPQIAEVQEMTEADEVELKRHFHTCPKNPSHAGFIRVSDLNMNHLPEAFRHEDILKFISYLISVTVRISVGHTSLRRPEHYPNRELLYPYHEERGGNVDRHGTGAIKSIWSKTGRKKERCPCGKCKLSNSPSKHWLELRVITASHVVYDDYEAKFTKCRLFFDDETSPKITVDCIGLEDNDVERDVCTLICVTCDGNIFNQLSENIIKLCILSKVLFARYSSSKLIFIVSHPHGCHKHVSIGEWASREWEEKEQYSRYPFCKYIYCKYNYNASTCPGSSGALVYILSSNKVFGHVHGGSSGSDNYSCSGVEIMS